MSLKKNKKQIKTNPDNATVNSLNYKAVIIRLAAQRSTLCLSCFIFR